MKKILLSVSVALLFASCTDLSMSNEEALNVDLPNDFKWQDYAEINKDVKASQVLFKIQEEKKGLPSSEINSNCAGVLSDEDFASEIYIGFAGCPEAAWNREDHCSGIYAGNDDYNILEADGAWTCNIGSCWSEGWDAVADTLQKYASTGKTDFAPFNMMCMYISPQAKGSPQIAKSYLDEEIKNLDSTLIKKHYFLIGQSEGRPYKYCEQGSYGEQRNREYHALKLRGGSGQDDRIFYDYSKNLFCLNKSDEKIYLVNK